VGDPRLLEDGGERGSALVSDLVEPETANKGRSEDGGRVSVSAGADSARKRTLWGSSALEISDHRLLEDGSERGGALVSDVVALETASEGWGGNSERVGVSMGADK